MSLMFASFSPSESVALFESATLGEDIYRSFDEIGAGGPNSLLAQRVADAFIALLEAAAAAHEPGWDGYRGQEVSTGAFLAAEALLRTIPAEIPMPEIDIHPDGQVGFDWLIDRDHMFSMSIDGTGAIAFAGISRAKKVTGRDNFLGAFPPVVRFHLSCLLAAK